MAKDDTEFILESWKRLTEQLMEVNESLRALVAAQQQTILKLQGIQTPPSNPNPAQYKLKGEK